MENCHHEGQCSRDPQGPSMANSDSQTGRCSLAPVSHVNNSGGPSFASRVNRENRAIRDAMQVAVQAVNDCQGALLIMNFLHWQNMRPLEHTYALACTCGGVKFDNYFESQSSRPVSSIEFWKSFDECKANHEKDPLNPWGHFRTGKEVLILLSDDDDEEVPEAANDSGTLP